MIDLNAIYRTPDEISQLIALQERTRRKDLKMSRKELSEKSFVSYASIRRFEETGKISLESLLAIALVLNERESFEKLFSERQFSTMKDFLNG